MPPAARIGDFHVCPMVTGTVPHVGGPVAMGSPTVLTGKAPQGRVGDMAVCVGPPDVVAKGSSGVFVNKKPAARLGDSTAHGGVIVVGCPTVIIGEKGGGGGSGDGGAGAGAGGFAGADLVAIAFAEGPRLAEALTQAAQKGLPFCEICFKAAQAKARQLPTPATTPAPAAAAPPSAPSQPLQTSKVCEIVEHTLACGHGRKPGPSGVLMVVPDAMSGDAIKGAITMKGGCGQHPAWSVGGAESRQGAGVSYSFTAKPPATTVKSFVTLQGVTPQSYTLTASGCQGSAASYAVHAYPPGKVSLKISFSEFKENLESYIEKALDLFPSDDDDDGLVSSGLGRKFECFVGYAAYEGGWKEDGKSWKAYYEKSFSVGFDPLVSGSYKASLYPPSVAPKWLEKWARAGLYGKIDASLKASAAFKGKYWPTEDKTDWNTCEGTLSGGVDVKLSVELKLADPSVVELVIAGGCGIEISGTATRSEEATIEVAAKFSGLKGSASIKALWGVVEYSREFQLSAEHKFDHSWSLTKTEEKPA